MFQNILIFKIHEAVLQLKGKQRNQQLKLEIDISLLVTNGTSRQVISQDIEDMTTISI